MEPDVHKLQELVEWAEAEEARGDGKQWDQRTWIRFHHPPQAPQEDGLLLSMQVTEEEVCNSSYCIAGKTVVDAGYRTFVGVGPTGGELSAVSTETGERDIESLALELLGIDPWEKYTHPITEDVFGGGDLFSPWLKARSIRIIAEAIAGKEL